MSARGQLATLIGAIILLVVVALVLRLGPVSPAAPPSAAASPSPGVGASHGSTLPAPSALPSDVSSVPPSAVLVGAGDIADCAAPGDEATADLLDRLEGTVFTLGDNVYENGSLDEFRRCYDPGWGRQLERTRPVPGNHDYNTPGAAGYFAYFGAVAGDPATGWYAYDAGSWRVYVLNSNCAKVGGCDAGSAQERWLRDDLAANPRTCVVAMWHHPRFSSGEHGSDASTVDLWAALADAGAELILSGHDHDYERFGPQTAAGNADPDRGIVELVVGTGGRSHYGFPTTRDNSLVRDRTSYGVVRLVLFADRWTSEFLPATGGTFTDSAGGNCH
jgi:3',5'-cyclic AMP phosphodiesterase CpdA